MLIRVSALAAVVWLLGSTDVEAFTFSDGSAATCMASAMPVTEIPAPPGHIIYQNGFTGMTLPIAPGRSAIYWNMQKLGGLPPFAHDFIFYHECAHASVPTSNELVANCEGLKAMRAAGRAGPQVESALMTFHASLGYMGPQYGVGSDYWQRTLQCANAGASTVGGELNGPPSGQKSITLPPPNREDPCQERYTACLSNVRSVDQCVQQEFPQRCIDVCMDRFGHSYQKCSAQLCQPTSTNLGGWRSRCSDLIKDEREACADARQQCREK